ncbi:MAG: dihydrolipoyl dehydrogenase [Corynebacterium flavescens]|uniref:dihydrolipoyl dehydrogenase n=2 Tax=Corynebacterium flavescens TaxID=28028 RepID=UPI0026473552|nr:dihydrolipoyl dehydrogenase [Corynebacterium flavescens]MDN6236388.1 dihydrolipoyl dehydrogenase [Corynebacterium flavescens]
MNRHYDVLIIGAGPGGYTAGIRAGQLGLKTAVVEKAELGGVCLNWGCIPTKALLHGAETAHTIASSSSLGFSTGEVSLNIGKLVGFSRSVAGRLSQGVAGLLKKNHVDHLVGTATLTAKGKVTVDGETIDADHIIVATGARPRALPGIVPDGDRIWTSTQALIPDEVPGHLLIVGSGAIGSEFASMYRDFGAEVTLVELAEHNLPVEDPDISGVVRKAFTKRGIAVHTGSHLEDVVSDGTGVSATLVEGDGTRTELRADRLLLAAGVVPNVEDLGLEALGVARTERGGFIAVDEWGKTNVAGIYAIGDVSGPPCLAHKAAHEAVATVEHLAGVAGAEAVDRNWIPGATYTRPEVASLGYTEAAARELAKKSGHSISVGRMPFAANGRAIGMEAAEGMVKAVFDDTTGELLGAHLVGPGVTELLPSFGVLRELEGTAEDIGHVVFAHPTLSEAIQEAALDALGKPLNQ